MRFFPFGIFWGLIFLLIGINIILKAVFNISIPFFRIIIGLFVIYLGLSLILGFSIFNKKGTFFPGKDNFSVFCNFSGLDYGSLGDRLEVNTLFSDSTVDVDKIDAAKMAGKTLVINTVFGNNKTYLDKDISYDIGASVAFGIISLPNGESISFGQMERSLNADAPEKLKIKISTVFGVSSFIYR